MKFRYRRRKSFEHVVTKSFKVPFTPYWIDFIVFCAAGPALTRGAGAPRLASLAAEPFGLLAGSGSHLRRLPPLRRGARPSSFKFIPIN